MPSFIAPTSGLARPPSSLRVSLALLASACGGESGAGSGDVQVTLRDFQIDLSTTTAAGDLTFDASNEGPSVHEFEIFSVPDGVDPTDLPVESNVADTDSQGLVVIDEVEDIAPATTASLTVSLEPRELRADLQPVRALRARDAYRDHR